jgi:hypothetical protein
MERTFFNPAEGDQAFLAKCLQMDDIGVQALADHITESPGILLKGAEWSEAEDDENGGHGKTLRHLYCVLSNGHKRALRNLSGSETYCQGEDTRNEPADAAYYRGTQPLNG